MPNAIVKRKTKYTIKLDLKEPCDFDNEYLYFMHFAKQFRLKIFKYESSCFWKGPAIIIKSKKLDKLRLLSKVKIEVSIDTLDEKNENLAIYPKISLDDKDIKYKYVFKKEEDPIELIEWEYNDHLFHLDKQTNIVYEHGTDIAIGKKVYKDGKFIIVDLYK